MKLCGRNEECFENGECWGHLEGVMCKHLSEKEIGGEIKSICFKSKEETKVYTTDREYKDILLEKFSPEFLEKFKNDSAFNQVLTAMVYGQSPFKMIEMLIENRQQNIDLHTEYLKNQPPIPIIIKSKW
jgi:hypothetical protein